MIVVPDRRLIAGQMPHRRGQTTFELIVIVRVQQIVFAVVLVVNNRLDVA